MPAILLLVFWVIDFMLVRNSPLEAGQGDFNTGDATSGDEGPRLGAVEVFKRVEPEILSRMPRAAHPDEALGQFDGFLARLPAGVQLFSLFDANPQLIDLVVDIAATSPALAGYLARHSAVFDAVIGDQRNHDHRQRAGRARDHAGTPTDQRRDQTNQKGRIKTHQRMHPGDKGKGHRLGHQSQCDGETGEQFDPDAAERCVRAIANPAPVLKVSAKTGLGMDGWLDWIRREAESRE